MRKCIMFSEWNRMCPFCGDCMYYSNKYKMEYAKKIASVCKKCKYKKISSSLTGKRLSDKHKTALKKGWVRRKEGGYIHPMLNKRHSDETKKKMILAKQRYNPWLGKHHSEKTKQKMAESWKLYPRNMFPAITAAAEYNKGKHHSKEHKYKISESNKGKSVSLETKNKIRNKIKGIIRSDDTREKLRIIKLKQLEEQGISRTFSKKACVFIENFGKKYGYTFIHGNNGGEVMLSGYLVDGYDKNKNVVFEYDEPFHENEERKKKDIKRTIRLINKCKCSILRYSERYNRFYWSFPDKSEIFIII